MHLSPIQQLQGPTMNNQPTTVLAGTAILAVLATFFISRFIGHTQGVTEGRDHKLEEICDKVSLHAPDYSKSYNECVRAFQ